MSDEIQDAVQADYGKAQELAAYEPPQQQAMSLLRDLVNASTNPAIDAGKTKALADLAMQMQDREAERRFRMAKHRAIMEMPRINKTGAITVDNRVRSRYSKWEDIDRVIRPILAKNNLILTFNVGNSEKLVTVQPILSYSDGELAFEERGEFMALAVDQTGSKNATQGAGSAASYGKRHTGKAMLNIIEEDEDDDGSGGAKAGYDALPDAHRELVDRSRTAAQDGIAGYEAWFKALTADERGRLAFNYTESGDTWHEQNKRAAALIDGAQKAA